jgi:Ca2+-binding EF-hand superfamily protein
VLVSAVSESLIRRSSHSAGTLSVQEFLAIPELEHNPLVNRVVHTFDMDKSGEVDFREFVTSLSVFATHEAQGKEQKYKCQSHRHVQRVQDAVWYMGIA